MIGKYLYSSLFFILTFHITYSQKVFEKTAKLMGVGFQFAVVAKSQANADIHLETAIKEVQRIENLISSWDSNSQTSLVNNNAGIGPVKVDLELFQLIQRSQRISKLSEGYFDISFASLDKVWYFHEPMVKVPDSVAIKSSTKLINYNNIILNKQAQTVFLKHKGMKIGFGAIGKGYAAEKVKSLLQKNGVKAGLINASGDITTWGDHPETEVWKVAITNPDKKGPDLAWFDLHNASVVTSGNYENYVTINNTHYTHIINPKTGWPVHGIKSVTLFSNNAELCDALSTTVFVMGKDKGLELINQLKHIECIIVDDANNIFTSTNLKSDHFNNAKH
jgi:thiamine biosynthesis lipoprotein